MISNFLVAILVLLGFFSAGVANNNLNSAVFVGLTLIFLMIVFQLFLTALKLQSKDLIVIISSLIGVGMLMLFRINPDIAILQLKWIAISYAVASLLLITLSSYKSLAQYKYILAFIGLLLMLSPIFFGTEIHGSKLWLKFGSFSFQPAEISKVMLAIFFAGYLSERYQILSKVMYKIGPFNLPNIRYFGPLGLMWIISLLILVFERDLGGALLFFATFIAMIYVSTGKGIYPFAGFILFFIGSTISFTLFSHLQSRVDIWINPWADPYGKGYQILQSMISFSAGGTFGSGIGYGSPKLLPAATSDLIYSAIAEELGMVGSIGILLIFIIFIARGLRIALNTGDIFGKLLSLGLTVTIGFQAIVIIGGVTKLTPLTGVTLPFVSYGGSSMLANILLTALLIKIESENTHEYKY